MLSKNRTLVLFVILAAVLAIFLVLRMTSNNKSNFRTKLPAIDSATITQLEIIPASGKTVLLQKESGKWLVISNGHKFDASRGSVINLLVNLDETPVKRVVATSSSQWENFKTTDSSGTRIRFSEGNDVVNDLVLGRFDYIQPKNQMPDQYGRQPQGEMLSYIRVADEEPVYAIDGMIALGMGKTANDYRDKRLTHFKKEDISMVTINYADGHSLSLKKEAENWKVNDKPADSATTIKYIGKLVNIRGKDLSEKQPADEQFFAGMTIQLITGNQVTLKAFQVDSINYLFTSSQNPTNVIAEKDAKLKDKLFVNEEYLKGNKPE